MPPRGRMIYVNVAKCLGCHSCELACAVEHSAAKRLDEAVRDGEQPRSRVHVGAVGGLAVPLQCRQCRDAPCVAVCPTKALWGSDDDSPVLIDHDLCVGCRCCILACPFGVIGVDAAGRAITKCDQCNERVARGELPACVAACPTKALQFRRLDEVVAEKRTGYLVQIEHDIGGGEAESP